MQKLVQTLEIKSVDEDLREISGLASTPDLDRQGDTVDPLGAKFAAKIPLLWQHNAAEPVGTARLGAPTAAGVPFTAKIARIDEAGELQALTDKAWQAVKAGLVTAVSIGFQIAPGGQKRAADGIRRITDFTVHELSLVTIAANPNAEILSAKELDRSTRAASGAPIGAATGRTVTLKTGAEKMAGTLTTAEQISKYRQTLEMKESEMKKLAAESGEKGETFDGDEQARFDDLQSEVETTKGHIKRLEIVAEIDARTAAPVEAKSAAPSAVSRAPVAAVARAPKAEPGVRFARYVKSKAVAQRNGLKTLDVATHMYGSADPELIAGLKVAESKAVVTAMNTQDDDALINVGGVGDFAEFLRPMTILGKFGAGGVPGLRRVPFRVALLKGTAGAQGYWVGEGAAKPLTMPEVGRTALDPTKCACITVISEELLRDSTPAADILVRDELAAALVAIQDTSFTDPANAGSAGVEPAGISNGITPIVSAGNDEAAVKADAAAALGAFVTSGNSLTTGVWIMSGSNALALTIMENALGQLAFAGMTVTGGEFMGLPVIVSETSGTDVTLVNATDIYYADDGGIRVDMSNEASLEMVDNPTGSSVTGTGASLVSMFQTNSVAFRAEKAVGWMRRRETAVALLSGVTWGQPAV